MQESWTHASNDLVYFIQDCTNYYNYIGQENSVFIEQLQKIKVEFNTLAEKELFKN